MLYWWSNWSLKRLLRWCYYDYIIIWEFDFLVTMVTLLVEMDAQPVIISKWVIAETEIVESNVTITTSSTMMVVITIAILKLALLAMKVPLLYILLLWRRWRVWFRFGQEWRVIGLYLYMHYWNYWNILFMGYYLLYSQEYHQWRLKQKDPRGPPRWRVICPQSTSVAGWMFWATIRLKLNSRSIFGVKA